jgi:hypothetical protein
MLKCHKIRHLTTPRRHSSPRRARTSCANNMPTSNQVSVAQVLPQKTCPLMSPLGKHAHFTPHSPSASGGVYPRRHHLIACHLRRCHDTHSKRWGSPPPSRTNTVTKYIRPHTSKIRAQNPNHSIRTPHTPQQPVPFAETCPLRRNKHFSPQQHVPFQGFRGRHSDT